MTLNSQENTMPLVSTFQFDVKILRSAEIESGKPGSGDHTLTINPQAGSLGEGSFQECSGLDIEMDVQEYLEGGRNDGVIKRVGRAKYTNLVFKRGMFYTTDGGVNNEMWSWIQKVLAGHRPVPRYDGLIELMIPRPDVVARWEFFRGLPAKIAGPQLNAKTGEIAIEELHIAHEGLRLKIDSPSGQPSSEQGAPT